MSSLFRRKSGSRVRRSDLALLGALLVSACNYSLSGGGGFPSDIRTIYIEPFENRTAYFDLEQEVFRKMLEELPGAFGVTLAGQEVAHAIVRGRIISYDDRAQDYGRDASGQISEVLQNQVELAASIQVIDVRRNVILWESSRVTGRGVYSPDAPGAEVRAREQAIRELVQAVVNGAQSQW